MELQYNLRLANAIGAGIMEERGRYSNVKRWTVTAIRLWMDMTWLQIMGYRYRLAAGKLVLRSHGWFGSIIWNTLMSAAYPKKRHRILTRKGYQR